MWIHVILGLGVDSRHPWHAGYHAGERPIPSPLRSASVRDFGGVGDGVTDDTHAFMAAIDSLPHGGVLWIPAGRYST